jgi:hypothetical protein
MTNFLGYLNKTIEERNISNERGGDAYFATKQEKPTKIEIKKQDRFSVDRAMDILEGVLPLVSEKNINNGDGGRKNTCQNKLINDAIKLL